MNLLYFTTLKSLSKQLYSKKAKKQCLCSELNANAQYKLHIAYYLFKLACKTLDIIAKIA